MHYIHGRGSAHLILKVYPYLKIVRGDFLLVNGDLVASVHLEQAIEKHKARPAVDKHSIMTKVCMQGQPGNCLRTKGNELVIATDK